ncbi:MAG: NDP-hexose 4-ketoreductase, partial [Planctomycetota bacterium]
KDTLMKEIERFFRPEFIGRLDDVIVFRPLNEEHLKDIVELELNKVTARLQKTHDLVLELDEDAKKFLIGKGTSADFGARPLRRSIEQYVEDPLSEDILRGNYDNKGRIVITHKKDDDGNDQDHLFFDAQDKEPEGTEEQQEALAAAADAT